MKFRLIQIAVLVLLAAYTGTGQKINDGAAYGGMSLVREPADVTGQYFVVFNSPPGSAERDMVTGRGATILYEYTIIPAFAARIPNAAALDAITHDPLALGHVGIDELRITLLQRFDPRRQRRLSHRDLL